MTPQKAIENLTKLRRFYENGESTVAASESADRKDALTFGIQAIAIQDDLVKALEGVIRVADRQTDEFAFARAALAKAATL